MTTLATGTLIGAAVVIGSAVAGIIHWGWAASAGALLLGARAVSLELWSGHALVVAAIVIEPVSGAGSHVLPWAALPLAALPWAILPRSILPLVTLPLASLVGAVLPWTTLVATVELGPHAFGTALHWWAEIAFHSPAALGELALHRWPKLVSGLAPGAAVHLRKLAAALWAFELVLSVVAESLSRAKGVGTLTAMTLAVVAVVMMPMLVVLSVLLVMATAIAAICPVPARVILLHGGVLAGTAAISTTPIFLGLRAREAAQTPHCDENPCERGITDESLTNAVHCWVLLDCGHNEHAWKGLQSAPTIAAATLHCMTENSMTEGRITTSPNRRERVRSYFSRQAHTHPSGSARGVWAWMRRLETPVVMELLNVRPGEAILDAGCGAGHYTQALVDAEATVTALDIEPAMIEAIRQRLKVETLLGDLMTVQLEPRFDKIVCAGVLEFVQEPGAVVANLAKGLRPGGTMVILVLAKCLPGIGYWLARRTNGIDMPMFSRGGVEALARGTGMRVQEARRAGYNWVARLGPVQ